MISLPEACSSNPQISPRLLEGVSWLELDHAPVSPRVRLSGRKQTGIATVTPLFPPGRIDVSTTLNPTRCHVQEGIRLRCLS